MDNNQFQKNVYQVPASPSGESLDAPLEPIAAELSQAEVGQRFSTIAREEVLQAFNQMTQDLEMSVSGFETRSLPEVALATPHPTAVELLQIAAELQERRARHFASLVERVANMTAWEKRKIQLFSKNSNQILNPSIENIIDAESELDLEVSQRDADVKLVKFFLHNDEWFYVQESTVPEKTFTNKYEVTESSILKSSSFHNALTKSTVTRTTYVDEVEASNLLTFSKKYYEKATGHVYVRTPVPRFRFVSKNSSKNK
jgi:hypothetical protein